MARENCDTGRVIYPSKKAAERGGGKAEPCPRCRGYHLVDDKPRSRRGGRRR